MSLRGETKVMERRDSRRRSQDSINNYTVGLEEAFNDEFQGAIMESLDYPMSNENLVEDKTLTRNIARKLSPPSSSGGPVAHSMASFPDILSPDKMTSLSLRADSENNQLSFFLMDGDENLLVDSAQQFALKLGCENKVQAKVVSIVGNTGEGKSYCLNRLFFADYDDTDDVISGEGVFSTSPCQDSCTLGVWAAYDPTREVIVLDTEGMLGQTGSGHLTFNSSNNSINENKRTRQLLKVLALSDIVIYKTRAERLHTDLFYFLGDASKSYNDHFSSELQKVSKEGSSGAVLGPTVVIFHETLHTDPLTSSPLSDSRNGARSAETIIRDRLAALNQDVSAFSKIRYFGAKRGMVSSSNDERGLYADLRKLIRAELEDTSVRSPRSVTLIFKAFQSLNAKFSGDLSPSSHRSFPDEYFTCQSKCTACESRCTKQMNHESSHATTSVCLYQRDLDNKQYFCLHCYHNGRKILVVPKASSAQESSWLGLATYAWSGFVLECRTCGVIYRSRQHWYGNETPESMDVVHTEISHIWPGTRTLQGTQNAARRLLDGFSVLSDTVVAISSAPSKSVSGWVADQIAPAYWRPNCEILSCYRCDAKFQGQAKIHHCRACGEGFCDACSNYRRPVPERGWGTQPVRVCHSCFSARMSSGHETPEAVQVRKYGEKVVGTLNSLATAVFEYPISALKDSARPAYWVPDEECLNCVVCSRAFEGAARGSLSSLQNSQVDESEVTSSDLVSLHHCRHCGHGVCDDCSKTRRAVPFRGWDGPVRVCNKCKKLPSP